MAGRPGSAWIAIIAGVFFLLCCGGTCALDAAGVIHLDEVQEEFVREMTTDAPKGAPPQQAK